MTRSSLFTLTLISIVLPGCAATGATAPAGNGMPAYPDVITAEKGGFTPEGIEYDNLNHRFMMGSVVEGRVYAMDGEGRLTVVADDPDVDSVVGIEVEEERGRILAASADPDVFAGQTNGFAELAVFDLNSGQRQALVDLSAAYTDAPEGTRFFPNDVVADIAGNIYVTDSFALVVYKVDTSGKASVFISRDQFPENQSINGIVAHPDGYLLIAGSGTGVLYKADVRNPDNFTVVGMPELMPGIDGMVWAGDGSLVMTTRGRTVVLSSHDNWTTAQIKATAPQGQASTVAAVGDDFYVIYPHFADQDPPTVEKVHFNSQ